MKTMQCVIQHIYVDVEDANYGNDSDFSLNSGSKINEKTFDLRSKVFELCLLTYSQDLTENIV